MKNVDINGQVFGITLKESPWETKTVAIELHKIDDENRCGLIHELSAYWIDEMIDILSKAKDYLELCHTKNKFGSYKI